MSNNGVSPENLLLRVALPDAVAAVLWNLLGIADREPDIPHRYARREGLIGRAAAERAEHHIVRDHPSVGVAELVRHRQAELTHTHASSLGGSPEERDRGSSRA